MHLNFNIGIVGHVDSGKTSLAKALSSVASTAAFDKSKQSQDRGITLDLGFSSFKVKLPERLKEDVRNPEVTELQFTLVDCPGHASLVRTIIGGAQIVDMLLLVIDATKGIQTQTGECIVIGELTCSKMIVVLNKIDLVPEENRSKTIEKLTKRIRHVLDATCFKNVPFVNVSASAGDGKLFGIDELVEVMVDCTYVPVRNKDGPFFMAVDHCFNISGRGTVLTGTVIQGKVQVKDEVQFPAMNLTRQVKSIQVYRVDSSIAEVGDRIGLCVSRFDKKLMERGIICTLNCAVHCYAVIIPARKIPHYKLPITSGSKFHISFGHETCMATLTFFSVHRDLIRDENDFDTNLEYSYREELIEDETTADEQFYALLEFGKLVYAMPKCLVIGSKLDMDVHTSSCRLAFSGSLLFPLNTASYKKTVLPTIKVFKIKRKEGLVDRMVNEKEVIVKNMFKKESNIEVFVGLKVVLSSGEIGRIEGHFGQTGKIKVCIDDGLNQQSIDNFNNKKRKSAEENTESSEPVKVTLEFKSYVFNKDCKWRQ